MPYFELTTNEQIKAVFTTSSSNLPDEVLDNYGLEDELGLVLDSLPGWDDPGLDPKVKRLLRLFAKYFCAATVAKTATVFILKKETDGSNEGQRSDKDGYSFLSAVFMAEADKYLAMIREELDVLAPAVPDPLSMSRVVPSRDPITQARESDVS